MHCSQCCELCSVTFVGLFKKCCVASLRATVEEDRRESYCGSRRLHSMQLCKLQLPPEVCVTSLWHFLQLLVKCHQQIQCWQPAGFLMLVFFFFSRSPPVACSVLQHDLQPFKGKISQDLMAKTVQRGVGTHYQVIGHKLYREHNCMFPAR